MTLYSPWHVQPHQEPSNTLPVRFNPAASVERVERVLSSALPAANSGPPPVVSIVRWRLGSQRFSIESPAPQARSSQANRGNWREQFKRVLRSFAAPAPYRRNWGLFAADLQIFGAVYRLLRAFSSLLNSSQEPSSGLTNRFQMFLRWVAHDEQLTTEPKACRTQTKGIRTT